MKQSIFSSLTCERLLPLLQQYTAPNKKDSQTHAWKHPKHPKKEWACLVGNWEGNRFRGKLYRHYKGQLSGGIALPTLTLEASPAGGISQVTLQTRISNSFLVLLLAFVAVAVLQLMQILSALPNLTLVPVLVLVGWLLMLAMVFGYTYDQYRHECHAVALTLKIITKAFDQ